MAELEKELIEADIEFQRMSETVIWELTQMSCPGPSRIQCSTALERMLAAADRLDEVRRKIRMFKRASCTA